MQMLMFRQLYYFPNEMVIKTLRKLKQNLPLQIVLEIQITDLKVDVREDEGAAVLLVDKGAEGRVKDGGEGLHGVEAGRLATLE